MLASALRSQRKPDAQTKARVLALAADSGSQVLDVDAQPAWHQLDLTRILGELDVSDTAGLSRQRASARLLAEGSNALLPPPVRSELRILVDQLRSVPVMMLGLSAVLSVATGGVGDAVAILAVIAINAAIGYATESGAERTIAALTHTPQPAVPVLRDGVVCEVPVEQLVRGDILVLHAGVFVAADARLVSCSDLTVDESSLTGESMPVAKRAERLAESQVALAERLNMVYRGTLVTGGSGQALVIATGRATQLGNIQALASSVEARLTPLQQQLDKLGEQLALGAGVACAATLGVGVLRGQALLPMFRTAISLGVAAVPEGLPTVAIITLANGLKRMRKEHVIVRQLSAVETLGGVQVVCLDKTGTLTINRMTVVAVQAGLHALEVQGGTFVSTEGWRLGGEAPDIHALLRVAVLCNEVELQHTGDRSRPLLRGSATESALIELALAAGMNVEDVRTQHPLCSTQRRAQARNYMATVHAASDGWVLALKGRPSEVLALCSSYRADGQVLPLDAPIRARIEQDNERLAGRALRVLGFAYRPSRELPDAIAEVTDSLIWVGLIGMQDPPREGVAEVIGRFHAAGVRTIMITGDQSATAQAVGKQVGIARDGSIEIVDSSRLDRVEPDVLRSLAGRADVFSRVSPAHKLQIVQALQDAGMIVAMTGDGVNDGPALKAADIGIAMGAAGTNAAREMADVVLEDDQLRTLISAIEQGRTIYDDIRKAVHFILATNLTEIAYTFTCVAAGLGQPLSPLQLLWINLITDVFPELALAAQPAESDVLSRPARDPARPMFTRQDLVRVGGEGLVMTLGALAAYLTTMRRAGPGPLASTVGFTTVTLVQLLHAISARSETHSVFDREPFARNRYLPLALGGSAVAQVLVNVLPGARGLLGLLPMGPADWLTALAAATGPFVINELIKQVMRTRLAADALVTPEWIPKPVT